jgi:integrase
MAVRKRTWTNRDGTKSESWIVDYYDAQGQRHTETFVRKKDAEARASSVAVNIRAGTHTALSTSITVAEAAANWLESIALEKRERSTLAQYRQHVNLHIVPRIGAVRLAALTTPAVTLFRDELMAATSRPLARKVLTSLKSILKDSQQRGHVAQNVALPVKIGVDKRAKRKLQIGIDIPTPDEMKRILTAAKGRNRAFLVTATFTGLRGSELRGLRWSDVDLKRGELHVRQRADRYNAIEAPKSESGERVIPIGPMVVNTLREWKVACPPSPHDLTFPTSRGGILRHENCARQILMPAQVTAGVVDAQGNAKYSGLHALRHFYASWCVNRRADGGLELPLKVVQHRLGHASITMTADTYGHLFPRNDDGAELAAAERLFLT